MRALYAPAGSIGSQYSLGVRCLLNSAWRSKLAPLGDDLPLLDLDVELTSCKPGSAPPTGGDNSSCVRCLDSTYDLEGVQCKACPKGATCEGNNLYPRRNWWHSSVDSDRFYSCPDGGACLESRLAGDDTCRKGGPACRSLHARQRCSAC